MMAKITPVICEVPIARLKPKFGLRQMKVMEAAVVNTAGTVAIQWNLPFLNRYTAAARSAMPARL